MYYWLIFMFWDPWSIIHSNQGANFESTMNQKNTTKLLYYTFSLSQLHHPFHIYHSHIIPLSTYVHHLHIPLSHIHIKLLTFAHTRYDLIACLTWSAPSTLTPFSSSLMMSSILPSLAASLSFFCVDGTISNSPRQTHFPNWTHIAAWAYGEQWPGPIARHLVRWGQIPLFLDLYHSWTICNKTNSS